MRTLRAVVYASLLLTMVGCGMFSESTQTAIRDFSIRLGKVAIRVAMRTAFYGLLDSVNETDPYRVQLEVFYNAVDQAVFSSVNAADAVAEIETSFKTSDLPEDLKQRFATKVMAELEKEAQGATGVPVDGYGEVYVVFSTYATGVREWGAVEVREEQRRVYWEIAQDPSKKEPPYPTDWFKGSEYRYDFIKQVIFAYEHRAGE